MQFHLYLPQMRMQFERLVATAQAAEVAGFQGIAGMDHLTPPMAESQPMYEAMLTNTWLAARTRQLKVSSLVLCDAMRHPTILAREAVTLDHASGGRFELGLGWGSVDAEFDAFGIRPRTPAERVRRLRESLQVIKALWGGTEVNFEGEFFHLRNAVQEPKPLRKIPIVIGGAGPKTLALVREFADWWNLDTRYSHKLEPAAIEELRSKVGAARVSVQQMIAYVHDASDRKAVTEVAMQRFSAMNPIIGTCSELVEHFGRLAEQGVERVYAWFCDFARPETLASFGENVIAPLRGPAIATVGLSAGPAPPIGG